MACKCAEALHWRVVSMLKVWQASKHVLRAAEAKRARCRQGAERLKVACMQRKHQDMVYQQVLLTLRHAIATLKHVRPLQLPLCRLPRLTLSTTQ